MNIHKLYGLILPYFRRKRYRQFTDRMGPQEGTTILDVGGYVWNWPEGHCPAKVTILNPHVPGKTDPTERLQVVEGDGCNMHFADREFDIAYSNSVIEHLSTFENQEAFANEVRRVGKAVWIQTPARWFIVEPHLMTPFIHYLPKSWRARLLRYFTVWGLLTKPTPGKVRELLAEIRLLTYSEMCRLFPDCEIMKERFFGMTKSYIAIRRPDAPSNLTTG